MSYKDLYEKAMYWQTSNNRISKDLAEYAFTFVYPPPSCLYELENDINFNALEELRSGANLYIHIPYCTGKCVYCYFCTYPIAKAPISIDQYLDLLESEIKLWNAQLGKISINSIHIGGGTPSILNEVQFKRLFNLLSKYFDIQNGIEITCETSPETLTSNKLYVLQELGVNRINVGIQSLDDNILKNIGRRHGAEKALNAINLIKESGIKNINVDLMYGLPGQTLDIWSNDLESILKLDLQSISTYRLRLHPEGELAKHFNQKQNLIDMYIKLLELMDKYGYIQASSHKFAKEQKFVQKQIINKRGVSKNQLLAIGLSSYGYLGNTLYWNARTMEEYKEKINANLLPCSIGYKLNIDEQKSKTCVLGVHNLNGINLEDYKNKFRTDIQEDFKNEIGFLIDNGFAVIDDKRFRLTKLGMVFADEIAIMFYSKEIKMKLDKQHKKYGIFFDKIIK